MTIVYAVLALGMLGLLLGLLLHYADKKFHVDADPRLAEIRACLGGANCGACGYAGCDAFAQAVADGEAAPEKCAPAGPAGAAKMAAVLGVSAEATVPLRRLCQLPGSIRNCRRPQKLSVRLHRHGRLYGSVRFSRHLHAGRYRAY